MKKILSIIAIVVISAVSAFCTTLCLNSYIKSETKPVASDISASVEGYLKNNAQTVLEIIAKNENFGDTIRHFSGIDEAAIVELVDRRIDERGVAAGSAESATANEEANNAPEEDNNALYKEHWNELINNKVSPSIGPKDAKITVVEFFDFACGHCKALAPIMSQVMKDNPDVRFIFNPLYFISEHSPYAAKVSLAAAQKGKFAEVFDGIMTLPDMNEETINQILADEGLNVDEIKKMIEEKEIRRGAQDIDSLSQVLGINGVPMLLINGESFYGRSVTELQNKINSLK